MSRNFPLTIHPMDSAAALRQNGDHASGHTSPTDGAALRQVLTYADHRDT